VAGRVQAQAFDTGDILFHAEGRPLWRMYEDQRGLQLEDASGRERRRGCSWSATWHR